MAKEETITIKKESLWKYSTFILAAILIVGAFVFFGKDTTTTTGGAQPTPSAGTGSAAKIDMKTAADTDAVLGDANAPVTIVEFSDFQCPYCKKFFDQTEGQIITDYVKTGKVRFIYRDFPLTQIHVNAEKAAEASECANKQGKYWEMHDKLFQMSQADGTGLAVTDLKKYAADLGLDTSKFNSCLDSGETASEIQKDQTDGAALGVQGTPGFIIGKTGGSSGQLIAGAYPYATFQQTIDGLLK